MIVFQFGYETCIGVLFVNSLNGNDRSLFVRRIDDNNKGLYVVHIDNVLFVI